MTFNEDSRVKIPAILHLTRLGYQYHSLKNAVWDGKTNIFTELFKTGVANINKGVDDSDLDRRLQDLALTLDNEDLGRAFFEQLLDQSGLKVIDFSNFEANSFHVVTELTYKNGDDEFRPDITLLINGLPLAFIEVKKPNNKDGVLAERTRINKRFSNPKFRHFINVTQLMVFSNNMEYDDTSPLPIEGAFYASASYSKPRFNYFREEEQLDLHQLLVEENDEVENAVLKDNNLTAIKFSPEFLSNKDPCTPTHRILTSLFCKERLAFILKYALAYVRESHGLEKHIMRYPQIFATKAIVRTLDKGLRKGIIWHTQGSGKTALAFYNVRHLTDYFQQKGLVPKFYFIVDRLDLLQQAKGEFSNRGLVVHLINSREDFSRDIKTSGALHNLSGKPEITVVNIQKFKDDPDVVRSQDYDIRVQRIYFLDEVHRSYNPKGSFLANLSTSDKNAIKLGLTGTPLLSRDYNSRDEDLFGDYIHKYYYNASIADGYTLRLIREEIETNYKMILQRALEKIEVVKGDVDKKFVFSHRKFVEPMLDYIILDFERSRVALNDASIGAMVICDSSEQAEMLYAVFTERNRTITEISPASPEHIMAADSPEKYAASKKSPKVTSAALILHDTGTKSDRKDWVDEFKAGNIDILFVYNMLLTGFDAKRLKKLYLGRVIKKHNLLQALTRVNRTYNDFRYGYVVDFADISAEFKATNEAYFRELQAEYGDEMEHYSHLFKTKAEIQDNINQIREALFAFNTENAEEFSRQISQIQDKGQVQSLKKALADARSLYNMIRLLGHDDLLSKLDFHKLNQLYREASNHLDLLHIKDNLENSANTENLLNVALEDVLFMFTKVSEKELILADLLKDTLRKTREALANNFDQNDPKFVSLKEELQRLFKKKNLSEVSQEEMNKNIGSLNKIFDKIKELNRQNDLLKAKYQNDPKYARVHKRLMDGGGLSQQEIAIFEALTGLKAQADEQVLLNSKILQNEGFFTAAMVRLVIDEFKNKRNIPLTAEASKFINQLIMKEYLNEFNGVAS